MLREVSYYSRMVAGIYQWARQPLEPDPRGLVRRTLERRDDNFLYLMREAVFAKPSNPFHTLFQWAGCTYGDLEQSVRGDGLEASLESLRKAGVYLRHDEFKGKRPIERGGRQLAVRSSDFANPLVLGTIDNPSSGSRSGGGTFTRLSLEQQLYREAQDQLFAEALGAHRRTLVGVWPILPSTFSLRSAVFLSRRGTPVDRWFALGGTLRNSAHYRTMTKLLALEARLLGMNVPLPVSLPQNNFSPVARWLARRRSEGMDCLLSSTVSNVVRVAAAAAEAGLDISGTLARTAGEALTDSKRAVIEAAGVKPYPAYTIAEIGRIGCSCLQMDKGNSVHVCLDSVAVISYRRVAPLMEEEVDSLLITPLVPFAPNVLVNVEMDDSGVLGPAGCDCPLKGLGLTQQISEIFSYGKLTGQGVTLLGKDLLQILETGLPHHFGGTPTDYQLVEQEGANQTEVELRVNPRIGSVSVEKVKSFFLAEMKSLYGGALSNRHWSQTNGFRVVLAEPYVTRNSDKVHALHLLGTSRGQRDR
jgi:hypothetical protein